MMIKYRDDGDIEIQSKAILDLDTTISNIHFVIKGMESSIFEGDFLNPDNGELTQVIIQLYNNNFFGNQFLKPRRELQARFSTGFKHPNVVRTISAIEIENHLLIQMQKCQGDLTKFFDLQLKFQKLILLDILQGIKYIHDRGFAHRDIQPANIFLKRETDRFVGKIGDFGQIKSNLVISQIGEFGTPIYDPLEILEDTLSDHERSNLEKLQKIDMWSIGVTFFQAMTKGAFPFNGETQLKLIADIRSALNSEESLLNALKKQNIEFQNQSDSDQFYELLCGVFKENPEERFSIDDMIRHRYFSDIRRSTSYIQSLVQTFNECFQREQSLNQDMREVIGTNNQKFYGNLRNGRKEGFGVLIINEEENYTGFFLNDQKHGKGIHWTRNNIYKGDFKQNKQTGRGKEEFLRHQEIEMYDGQYMQNQPEGLGYIMYKKGEVYMGQFQKGRRCGLGTNYFSNGSRYVGEFENNNFNGLGKLYDQKSELIYQGSWKNGIKDGFGRSLEEKQQYIGEFRDHGQNGYGILRSQNQINDTYVGGFLHGKKQGIGILIQKEGQVYFGRYRDNQFQPQKLEVNENGFVAGLLKESGKCCQIF